MFLKGIINKKIMKWHVFFIMWISWSGKWTLINNLKKEKNNNFLFPLSNKTRKIRINEINKVDANFISREKFEEWIKKWEFLEYAIIHWKEYYWTKISDIKKWIEDWKNIIKELDIIGLKKIKKFDNDFDNLYTTIFFDISIEILKQRVIWRDSSITHEELERRINSALIEKNEAKKLCDYIINTEKSEKEVLKEVLGIIFR